MDCLANNLQPDITALIISDHSVYTATQIDRLTAQSGRMPISRRLASTLQVAVHSCMEVAHGLAWQTSLHLASRSNDPLPCSYSIPSAPGPCWSRDTHRGPDQWSHQPHLRPAARAGQPLQARLRLPGAAKGCLILMGRCHLWQLQERPAMLTQVLPCAMGVGCTNLAKSQNMCMRACGHAREQ